MSPGEKQGCLNCHGDPKASQSNDILKTRMSLDGIILISTWP